MNPMYKMRSCSISRPAYCTVKTRLHRSYLPGVIMSFCMTISVSVLLRAYYCILGTTSKIRLCSKRSIPTPTPKKPYAIGQHHPRLGKQLRSLWQTANSEMAYPKIRRILQWNEYWEVSARHQRRNRSIINLCPSNSALNGKNV
jgi:hypothetical protein